MGIWYATREQVQDSLEVASTSASNRLTDRALEAATGAVHGLLRRRFYPELKTVKFDWPNYQGAPSWQLWLDTNELISLTSLVSGGVTIAGSNRFLRRSDDIDEPPYNIIELDLGSAAAFTVGDTYQRSIEVTGVFGHNDTATSLAAGTVGGNINSSVTTLVINPSSGIYNVGVGSLVLIGTERMILADRRMSDTGQNLQSNMDDLQSDSIVDVTDGTAFAVGETILLGSERMRIRDIAGNNLIVDRAWDGFTLTTHTAPEDIYALRTFSVQRGVLGSTAASHTAADAVYDHTYPGLINELAIAEAVVLLEQQLAGYARTVGSGASSRESGGQGLIDLRNTAQLEYGRVSRSAVI